MAKEKVNHLNKVGKKLIVTDPEEIQLLQTFRALDGKHKGLVMGEARTSEFMLNLTVEQKINIREKMKRDGIDPDVIESSLKNSKSASS